MRYFNGECHDFAQEAVSCITTLSLTLKNAQNFEDYHMAVKSVEQECANVSWVNYIGPYNFENQLSS